MLRLRLLSAFARTAPEETVQIINGLKPKYEAHHDVRYTAKAVRAAVELAVKYINDRHLPDKAIDVIDEAGARARLMPVSKRKKTVNVADIESVALTVFSFSLLLCS